MEKNTTTATGWFSLALTLVFITLKLTDQIDWSWGWGACANLDSVGNNYFNTGNLYTFRAFNRLI